MEMINLINNHPVPFIIVAVILQILISVFTHAMVVVMDKPYNLRMIDKDGEGAILLSIIWPITLTVLIVIIVHTRMVRKLNKVFNGKDGR